MKYRIAGVALTVSALMAPAALRADADRLKAAADVLTEMAGMGDKGIPLDLIKNAKCLVIIPAVKKAFAVNASVMVRPASRRKSVLIPQMNDDANVDKSVIDTYVLTMRFAARFIFRSRGV